MPTRHRNDGLTKRCTCRRRDWSRCAHPYHLSFMWKRTHYRLSLGVSSKTEAKTTANAIRDQIRAGTYGPQPTTAPVTLRQLFDVYFSRYVELHRSAVAAERRSRKMIETTEIPTTDGTPLAFGDWPVADITADTLERFKEVRVVSGGGRVAINRNLTLLRAAFNWCIHPGGYLMSTPFKVGPKSVVKLFPEHARERRLEDGEEQQLLAACNSHLRALVIAALETSCRVGELLSLQWRQVRWDQNEIHLPGGKTKSKKPRHIPVSQRLHAVLEMRRTDPGGADLPPDAYVFGNEIGEPVKSVKTAWRLACKRARISGLHFHDLRREAASRLLEGNVPDQYVKEVLGHADLTTTSRYLATTRKGLHQVMSRYERRREEAARVGDRAVVQTADLGIAGAGSLPRGAGR